MSTAVSSRTVGGLNARSFRLLTVYLSHRSLFIGSINHVVLRNSMEFNAMSKEPKHEHGRNQKVRGCKKRTCIFFVKEQLGQQTDASCSLTQPLRDFTPGTASCEAHRDVTARTVLVVFN